MASLLAYDSFGSLPPELLLPILGHATNHGDLASLRLVTPSLNNLILGHRRSLLQDLCSTHRISDRLLDVYCTHHAVKAGSLEGLIRLSQEISILRMLCEDEQRLNAGDGPITTLCSLLWFSSFTAALKSGIDLKHTLRDILSPSDTIDSAVTVALADSFKDWLQSSLSLLELEAVITAINIAASKLWSSVFLYKAPLSRVNTFASLSGHTFNIEQAILTEHIIWHGPRWTSRLLMTPALPETEGLERRLHLFGPWHGSKEDGARIAANGLTRLLWKERQRKIDEEHKQQTQRTMPSQSAVTTLPINPVIWRGSSGDL